MINSVPSDIVANCSDDERFRSHQNLRFRFTRDTGTSFYKCQIRKEQLTITIDLPRLKFQDSLESSSRAVDNQYSFV